MPRPLGAWGQSTRRRLAGWAAALALVAAVPAVAAAGPVQRYLFAPETVMTVQLKAALPCGDHLTWGPRDLDIRPGTRVRFVNGSQFWHIPIKITADESPLSPAVAESPPLPPGASWTYTFWRPGNYLVTSSQLALYWSGVKGWVNVQGL